jgi:hypothetical protein
VFPHRYGPLGREVFALSGDVTRFRASDDGATDLELRVPFPSLLSDASDGSVDVNVFVVDSLGAKLSSVGRSIATDEEAVLFRLTAPEGATDVVVEFRDPATGRVAALRQAAALARVAGQPGISDLLVTHRATPDRKAVVRRARWIRPLPLTEVVEEPVVGAFFELYDIKEATSWYRVRAEVESLETGERYTVPVRPAGEDGYRATWDRVAGSSGAAGEFVGLALGNVPAGRYTLRIVVDFPLAGEPLVAERTLTLG